MSAIRNTAIPQNNQSSKRTQSYQSLNHLTNFSLPPRAQHVQAAPRRSRRPLTQQVWNKESTQIVTQTVISLLMVAEFRIR